MALKAPQDNVTLLEWFSPSYETVFVVLHPFLKVRPGFEHLVDSEYWSPQKHADKVPWATIANIVGADNIGTVNRLLCESIYAWRRRNDNEVLTFAAKLDAASILPPDEGDFPPVLVDDFLASLESEGHDQAYVADELTDENQLLSVAEARQSGIMPYPHPTLYSPGEQILYTVHWDSHFTFLCSDNATVLRLVERFAFEGFYCDRDTKLYWGAV